MVSLDLRLGDSVEILPSIPGQSVDAIITDPPYPKEFDHVWIGMARESRRLLKDRGNLVTLLGHYQLPFVLDIFKDELRYWWIGGMNQPTMFKMFGKGVVVRWKPCLWFINGKRRVDLPDMPMDMLSPRDPSKALHEWQQPVSWFEHWIERLTLPGETVLDPFMGSGTTGVACMQTGRNFIGIELDPTYYAIAEKRINAAKQQTHLFY